MKEKKMHIKNDPGFPKLETGYSVPEGYFESFGERLNHRMEAEKLKLTPKKNPGNKGILFYLKPALSIAAGLAILVTVFLYPYVSQVKNLQVKMQDSASIKPDDLLSNTYASLMSDGQFFLALTEMEDYDASKISKEGLSDYLASNCSEFEILNDNN